MSSSTNSPYYGYIPSAPANIVGAVLFGILLILTLRYGAIHKHKWFNLFWRLGLILEFMGYVARSVSHSNPDNSTAYSLQYSVIFIAPAFLLRAVYYQLGKLLALYDYESVILKSKRSVIVFIVMDLVSLILQIAGGAVTGVFLSETNAKRSLLNTGRGLSIAGLAIQVVLTIIFIALMSWFWIFIMPRHSVLPEYAKVPERRFFGFFAPGLILTAVFLFVRSIFRIVYDADLKDANLRNKEIYVLILDGLMVLIAAIIGTLIHPSTTLGEAKLPVLKKSKDVKVHVDSEDSYKYDA